jgi:hypothetical protein
LFLDLVGDRTVAVMRYVTSIIHEEPSGTLPPYKLLLPVFPVPVLFRVFYYRTLHELVFLFFSICRTDKEVFYKHSPFLTRSIEMIMNDNANVCHFKLVLLGDAAVGKSCLVVRFVRDEFFEFQEPTIGGENN